MCELDLGFVTRDIKGAFDLLKNEGHDRTTLVVQCLICKTVSGTGQTGGKGQDKNSYFCPSPNHILAVLQTKQTLRVETCTVELATQKFASSKVAKHEKVCSDDQQAFILSFFTLLAF
ncbi:hypothetical protein MTR_1g079640 [Medicago truncatula]|uniref:Uncharacterized protein n=1 Tax=Medicago truncatula TaxID=3880 RepID=G7I660_MEDTR|nr:hypothetical protein MTR_1g079640 [Medicago truncatula]